LHNFCKKPKPLPSRVARNSQCVCVGRW